MTTPKRIQLRRVKGWRMPENTVKVDRGTRWGNPFTIDAEKEAGYRGSDAELRSNCVHMFRSWIAGREGFDDERRTYMLRHIDQLRGKNLACWCPLDGPCHADVLIEIANATPESALV